MKVNAPGKLILSGEHAVVYGRPAIAMAVNRYVTAKASAQALPLVSFDLSDLREESRFHFSALRQLKTRIKNKYERFIKGEFKISEVLQKPVELAHFAFSLFFDALNIKLSQGIKIHIQSDIPMGCGMGSSAATILSVVHAIAHFLGVELSPEMFYRLGLEAENMQHGFSSGLDLRVSQLGGCLYLKAGEIQTRPIPEIHFYLVHTGLPQSTTGEAVSAVSQRFQSSGIWDEFESVTNAMDLILQNRLVNAEAMKPLVEANHELLVQIGVVPARIQQFIRDISDSGAAAKICGAGAVRGEQGGALLVITEEESHLKKMCEAYGYTILPVRAEPRGVHVI